MKKILNLVFLYGGFLAPIGLLSCNSDGIDEVEVSVTEKVECSGDLRPYVQLSKGDYTLKKLKSYKSLGGDKLAHMQLTIAFDGIKAAEVSDLELILSIVDDNYNQVNSKAIFKIDTWSSEAQKTIISGIKSGEGKFSISISTESAGVGKPIDADEWSEIKKKAKYIVISSSKGKVSDQSELEDYYSKLYEENPPTESEGEFGPMPHGDLGSDDDMSENSSNNDAEFDEWLKSYEKYVDRYISFMKKAKNGDMSAMSEYGKLLEEANDYMEKLEKVKGNLTPSQLNKYNQINIKKIEALQKMN